MKQSYSFVATLEIVPVGSDVFGVKCTTNLPIGIPDQRSLNRMILDRYLVGDPAVGHLHDGSFVVFTDGIEIDRFFNFNDASTDPLLFSAELSDGAVHLLELNLSYSSDFRHDFYNGTTRVVVLRSKVYFEQDDTQVSD